MPKEMVSAIIGEGKVGTTKKDGHGLGIQQIKRTLDSMNGQMHINSEESVGTEIVLTFPKSDPPKWFENKLTLHRGDIVVVLDNDISIHDKWKQRFKDNCDNVTIKYFTKPAEAVDFIKSVEAKEKVFLLTDYEFKDRGLNGIDVIEECNMQERSILVTDVYISKIKDFNKKSKFLKVLHKAYINNDILLVVKER
jgi:hypothetical protein